MKQYNVVIIGAGNIGAGFDSPESDEILTHAHAFLKNDKFNLIGFYDVDFVKAASAANKWNVQAFVTMESAMKHAEVVCCTVPDAYHYQVLKEIAEYPVKLVFAEKPITKTEEQAEEICLLYKEKNIPILVNYTRRFVSEFIRLRERIRENEFGRYIRGTGYYGKGILHNGSHMLDFLSFLLSEHGEICEVKGKHPFVDFEEDDPCVEVSFNIAGGSFYMHPLDCNIATLFEIDMFFEKARIRMTDGCRFVEEYEVLPSLTYQGYYNYCLVEQYNIKYDSSFENAVENIFNILENGEELLCNKKNASDILKICKILQKAEKM